MKSVELILTFKCDWDCDYCLVDTHNQPNKPFEDVVAEAEAIEPYTEVTLSGGETGSLTKAKLKKIIKILKDKHCVIDLLTNGLFIKKHPELLDNFEEVLYHCVEYLDHDIQFPDLDQKKFLYIIIATNDTLKDGSILRFIERYPHIKFIVLPDTRGQRRIDFNLMNNFIRDNKDKIHERTMHEWKQDMLRVWGE